MGEHFVQSSGTVAVDVDRNKSKTDALELTAHAIKYFHVEGFGQFFPRDFDSGDVAMMPHAGLAEAKGSHDSFTLIDHPQLLDSNRRAVRNPRRQTRRRRLIPCRQTVMLRQRADFRLTEFRFD